MRRQTPRALNRFVYVPLLMSLAISLPIVAVLAIAYWGRWLPASLSTSDLDMFAIVTFDLIIIACWLMTAMWIAATNGTPLLRDRLIRRAA